MLIISHLGIPLAFIFLTTVLHPLWFVSFLSGQSSRKGEFFSFFHDCIDAVFTHWLSFIPGQARRVLHSLQIYWAFVDHIRRSSYMNKQKISMGHREPPLLNILGFCRRGLAFNPCPDVLVTPSLKVVNSIPLLSFAKQKSSIFIS